MVFERILEASKPWAKLQQFSRTARHPLRDSNPQSSDCLILGRDFRKNCLGTGHLDLRKLGFQPERLIFHVASTQAWILLPSFPTRSAGASEANLQTHCPGKALARTFNCLRARGLLIGKPAIAQLVKHLTVVSCGNQMVPGSIPAETQV